MPDKTIEGILDDFYEEMFESDALSLPDTQEIIAQTKHDILEYILKHPEMPKKKECSCDIKVQHIFCSCQYETYNEANDYWQDFLTKIFEGKE